LSEPFGLETSASVTTSLQNDLQSKWNVVINQLRKEHEVLTHCRTQADACPPAAAKFLAIVDSAKSRAGLSRIGEINRAVNLAVRWVDDMTQYGVPDLWATPLMTFASNAGNCKDYAISKYVALQEMGFATNDLRVVVVRDRPTNQLHAIAAVRYEGHWLILDNRTLMMVHDVDIATYNPLFVMDNEGVKRMLPATAEPQTPNVSVSSAAIGQQFSNASAGAPLLL
jgi:predicted transglutaminase-like cysteine proteinase